MWRAMWMALVVACGDDVVPMPDAAECIPVGSCGACDCDESTELQMCSLCPGKPDGGVGYD
jgi:hypothetical protein